MKHLPLTQGAMLLALFFLSGCATGGKNIQPQINTLVIANRLERAITLLDEGPSAYGNANELLYWLDRGMSYHLAGRYQDSINALIRARRLVDVLYGKSSREIASTWLVNDSKQRYRADEYEQVMINIIQALNYALLGNIDEALVEARDVNKQLALIGARHPKGLASIYRDDAFAWTLMGLLWEMEGSSASINDAVIAYERAVKVYDDDYQKNFNVQQPDFLKRNLERVKRAMDGRVENDDGYGEVYIIQYAGFAPMKTAKSFVVPLGFTRMTKISLPDFEDRYSEFSSSMVSAQGHQLSVNVPTVPVQPIGQMAKQIMKNRIAWLTTKGVLRPALKLAGEYVIEQEVRQRYGDWQADAVAILGSIYNLATEEADTRSWQTLPNEIRMACLRLRQGHWRINKQDFGENGVKFDNEVIGEIDIKSGEKKILLVRSAR